MAASDQYARQGWAHTPCKFRISLSAAAVVVVMERAAPRAALAAVVDYLVARFPRKPILPTPSLLVLAALAQHQAQMLRQATVQVQRSMQFQLLAVVAAAAPIRALRPMAGRAAPVEVVNIKELEEQAQPAKDTRAVLATLGQIRDREAVVVLLG